LARCLPTGAQVADSSSRQRKSWQAAADQETIPWRDNKTAISSAPWGMAKEAQSPRAAAGTLRSLLQANWPNKESLRPT